MQIESPITPQYDDQKAGTSGLRKPTKTFTEKPNYLANYVQATFNAVASENNNKLPETIVVGGDGRYYGKQAVQIILKLAAGNGIKKVVVGHNGLLSTPAVSALVRRHVSKPEGAFILTASHNPGGPNGDFGIKYNGANGGPAQESLTNKIFDETKSIKNLKIVSALPEADLSALGTTAHKLEGESSFTVEIVDAVANYAEVMKECFDFDLLKKNLFARKDFQFYFDGLNGIAGPYAKKIFIDLLGADPKNLHNCDPKEDFGGLHPDPNLTYAPDLVQAMGLTSTGEKIRTAFKTKSDLMKYQDKLPVFGAACDGDADRNMVLGREFFVTPSDSVAVIAANAKCIPYFSKQGGIKSVARSMPTSAALDRVAEKQGLKLFEVPTGWKFFGNLMDSDVLFQQEKYTPLICGEESFGTGSDHVREKDGIWAVLAWLSILASKNTNPEHAFVHVGEIVNDHWAEYGRNFYTRYDYEGVESEKADAMMAHLRSLKAEQIDGVAADSDLHLPATEIDFIDDFEYTDPVDKKTTAKQGIRVVFKDGSRFVFRLSGTGSSGATIRLYIESYTAKEKVGALARTAPSQVLKRFVDAALKTSKLQEFTGRDKPTVIT